MYEITSDETGRTFVFSSEEVYCVAEYWRNKTPKAEVISFCSKHGLDLLETENTLIEDWDYAATELFDQITCRDM